MSLYFASLNSGSNGNCYLIGTIGDYVLIDAGISMRETLKRLSRLSVSIREIKAIFISHEHADHIAGLQRIVSTHNIPVYISKDRKSTRLNSSHIPLSRMPSSA